MQSACWRAEAAWALATRDSKDLAWVLTQEWALSICAAKTSTWALTREWALARDTMVFYMDTCLYVDKLVYVPQDHFNCVV